MQQKSEIQISGVILRGGGRDEAFLKALTLGEMDAGLFEKKVKLGNRGRPAVVDTDGITALLDNGKPFHLVTSSVSKNEGLEAGVLISICYIRQAYLKFLFLKEKWRLLRGSKSIKERVLLEGLLDLRNWAG